MASGHVNRTGLSDRNVADVSFATMLEDLETVVNSCKFSRFALRGIFWRRGDLDRLCGALSRSRVAAGPPWRLCARKKHAGFTAVCG